MASATPVFKTNNMAIYFNEKILEPKANGTSLEKRYYSELQEVKNLFNKFRKGKSKPVLLFSREYRKVWNRAKTSHKPAPPIAIPMNVNIYDNELGSVEIRYSRRPPVRSGKNVVWQHDQDSLVFETLSLDETRMDLAWFLLYASNFVKNGIVKLIDKEVEYEGTVDKMKEQMKAAAVIFDESVSYERLKAISDFMFPGKIELNTDKQSELAAKLWSIIQVNENNKKPGGYKDLVNAGDAVGEILTVTKESSENITVELKDGRTFEVESLFCPPKISNEKLAEKAKEYSLEDSGLPRNQLYSLLKHLEAER